ncbi:MAG: carboxypeptidase M32 [Rhodothermales bacterium]|nr:carboxypeptidase M32 [Rhodothermales bacterium]
MFDASALRHHLATAHDLNASATVLEWDQETYMPDGGEDARAHQVATLRRLAHEHFASDTTSTLLARAEAETPADPLVVVARRDFDRATLLPPRLVAETAEAVARAKSAWRRARETNTFSVFAPHLERLVALNVERANLAGFADTPYDALLDLYEPGLTARVLDGVLGDLRRDLVPIVEALAAQPRPDDAFLRARYPTETQWTFTLDVLRDVGFDFQRGRQDLSAHPFTTSFAPADVRLTTRVDEHFFPTAFFGTLHEAGHGLYEQGIDEHYARTLLAEGTSLGMHESQSRLWENQVGRSRAFWAHYLPQAQRRFPDALAGVSLDAFYRAVNAVEPSPIRVEADEVTYNLHIMLRTDLERALVEGRLAVADLPEAWNEAYRDVLNLVPGTDALGVLQDVHWSLGTFGYFPTYTLGTLMSAQLFDAAEDALGPMEGYVERGDFLPLLGWMREHVHRYGRAKSAAAILLDATGQSLDAAPWLAYIRTKYGALYPGAGL